MGNLTRVVSCVLFLLLFQTIQAAAYTGREIKIVPVVDSANRPGAAIEPAPAKICSCQIMNMQSTNYQHTNLALFAEKTPGNNWKNDLRINNRIIEKEKKHLKDFFYEKLSVINQITVKTDCKSLFARLRFHDRSLVLYDILDADAIK